MHKFKHTDERSFMCDLCGACFKNRIYLKQHTNGMHSKEKVEYKCSQCEAVFKRQLGLTVVISLICLATTVFCLAVWGRIHRAPLSFKPLHSCD